MARSLSSSVCSFSSARAWRSVSSALRKASKTGALCRKSRSLLATPLWLFPKIFATLLEQRIDALCFFNKIQILPLEILHQRSHSRLPVIHLHHDAGNLRKACPDSRPEPPFPGDKLIAHPHPADGQRLQNAVLANGFGEFFQGSFPEDGPGLGRIGLNGPGRQEDHPACFHISSQFLTLHSASSFVYP